jgi:hypothetical protein
MRQGCVLSPLLFNIVLEFQAREIRQEQKIKGIQIQRGKNQIFLFTNDIILYLKDPKHFIKNLL